ncbi:MAG: hypothetical protein QUS14_14810, partial [Pyrinomonadaceae bacterium]|nr:hypothetical protein [Pyrinomonadaceae bacterium]
RCLVGSEMCIRDRLASTEKGIAVLRTTFSAEARASAMKFLDSLETPDLKLIVDEKLREATPEDLPACDAETLTVSDLVQNHLKGRVKSITIEREEIKDGKATRELRGVQEYDQKGRLLKAVVYRSAFRPEYVYVYGCIDGKRVTNIGDVSYENRFTAYGPSRPGAKPRDKRYTSHFELKLDDKGRVNEKRIFGNDSILHTSIKYIYGENKVETVTTDDEGKETSRNALTLDANGQMVSLVDSRFGSGPKKIEWSYTYKFDVFDKQGNWVKSSGIYELFEEGKLDTTSAITEYRTITYFK